jgi:hypothetical protein
MITEDGPTQYSGRNFLTVVEARWAVFFDATKTLWHYDPDSEWGLPNQQYYRPQFSLPGLNGYLEVRGPNDHQIPEPQLYYHPEVDEPAIYLAVGDLPGERQLAVTGWWDSECHRGVMELTHCFEWKMWFPPNSPEVLRALELARIKEFEPAVPPARQPEEEVRDIPEREREQQPE